MPNIKLKRETRDDLGKLFARYIDAAEESKGEAPRWWESAKASRINAVHSRATNTNQDDDPGYQVFHVPFSSPRQRTLTAQICSVVCKQQPIVLNVSDEDEIAESKQKIVDRIWRAAKFKPMFKRAVTIATDTDLAFMRLCPAGPGLCEWTTIHPKDMAVFPAFAEGMEMATFLGHRVKKPRRWILRQQNVKGPDGPLYYGDAYDEHITVSPDDASEDVGIRRSGTDPSEQGPKPNLDGQVDIWDAIVRIDLSQLDTNDNDWTGKEEKLYHVVICKEDSLLLSMVPYTPSTPWYFEVRLLGAEDYWPETSVGRDLGPLQEEYSLVRSALYNGTMRSQETSVIGPLPKNSEKMVSVGNVNFIDSDDGPAAYLPNNVRPDLNPLIEELNLIRMEGDQIASISQNTAGADAPDQTATEASIVAAGVSVGIEDKIEMATADLPRAAALTLEFVSLNPTEFESTIGIQNGTPQPSAPQPMGPQMAPQPDMSQGMLS